MDDDTKKLRTDVDQLLAWQKTAKTQLIQYPLDNNALTILNRYFLSIKGRLDFTNSSGLLLGNIIVQQDGKLYLISVQDNLIPFTVNTTSDILTLGNNATTGKQGTFSNDAQLFVNSTGDLPTPLVDSFPYYVVNSTGTTIQLALTSGGSPIDITDSGSGDLYVELFD